jgi:hypothetical protein
MKKKLNYQNNQKVKLLNKEKCFNLIQKPISSVAMTKMLKTLF